MATWISAESGWYRRLRVATKIASWNAASEATGIAAAVRGDLHPPECFSDLGQILLGPAFRSKRRRLAFECEASSQELDDDLSRASRLAQPRKHCGSGVPVLHGAHARTPARPGQQQTLGGQHLTPRGRHSGWQRTERRLHSSPGSCHPVDKAHRRSRGRDVGNFIRDSRRFVTGHRRLGRELDEPTDIRRTASRLGVPRTVAGEAGEDQCNAMIAP